MPYSCLIQTQSGSKMKTIILGLLISFSSATIASTTDCSLAAHKRLMYEISLSLNSEMLPLDSIIINKFFKFYTRPSRDGSKLRHEYKAKLLINDKASEIRFPVFEFLETGKCQ